MTPDFMLSWDLHVHPGEPTEGRWGDGFAIKDAARRAGVRGFVWKSHVGSTAELSAALGEGEPRVIPSITLNSGVGARQLQEALRNGVRWIWGPSRDPGGELGWELPLPSEWPAMRRLIAGANSPIVLTTSHLDSAGRTEFAGLCATRRWLLCSVTHSLYLEDAEVVSLAQAGAVFEADLYTMTHRARERALAPLAERVALVNSLQALMYLTSDAGQAATGDPYVFVAAQLDRLGEQVPNELPRLAQEHPDRVVRHLNAEELLESAVNR